MNIYIKYIIKIMSNIFYKLKYEYEKNYSRK